MSFFSADELFGESFDKVAGAAFDSTFGLGANLTFEGATTLIVDATSDDPSAFYTSTPDSNLHYIEGGGVGGGPRNGYVRFN